ncbi:MAG: fibronectin type III domain-containing protein [Deltaproteobacteria bacterium]|nr:fibronectin type III domain-containing protein [Deltaproteobacteria bacterium]
MTYRAHFAFLPLLLLGLYPCEDTGPVQSAEDMGPPNPGRDMGMPIVLEEHSYTPDGCSYEVSTPLVVSFERGGEDVGADADPIHVHVGVSDDTTSTFNVNWSTDLDTKVSTILYGTDQAAVSGADAAGTDVMEASGHTFVYETTVESLIDSGFVRIHEVHVCGLDPATTYYYKVGAPGAWSPVRSYSTAPSLGSTDPWSFGATGDSRNNVEDAWTLSQQRMVDAGVDMEVFSGDAVFLGTLQVNWNDFFSASVDGFTISDALGTFPIFMSNGNHDNLSTNYLAQFAMPQDVSAEERGQGEEWYSFDYANAHFLMLNDTVADEGILNGAQAEWMRADLAAVDRSVTPWVFAVHHRPFYTCLSTHRPDQNLRGAWQPIFDEYQVDIVFTGHNHVYERSNPIRGLEGGQGVLATSGANGVPEIGNPGTGSGDPSGTLYLVAAGVGAPIYDVSEECPFTNTAFSQTNYAVVEIEDRTITITARNVLTDAVIDQFSYVK